MKKQNRLKAEPMPEQTETWVVYSYLNSVGKVAYKVDKPEDVPENTPENKVKQVFEGSFTDCVFVRMKVGTYLKGPNLIYCTTAQYYLQAVFN